MAGSLGKIWSTDFDRFPTRSRSRKRASRSSMRRGQRPVNVPDSRIEHFGQTPEALVEAAQCIRPRAHRRSNQMVRRMAVELLGDPPPTLTRTDLEVRWRVGPDTVRKLVKLSHPDLPDRAPVPLWSVLQSEGVVDPMVTWAFATSLGRKILCSDLLHFEGYAKLVLRETGQNIHSWKRHLANYPGASIRIGKKHRFRPDSTALEVMTRQAQEPQNCPETREFSALKQSEKPTEPPSAHRN